eukprot:1911235-Rhodomonas_salina.3
MVCVGDRERGPSVGLERRNAYDGPPRPYPISVPHTRLHTLSQYCARHFIPHPSTARDTYRALRIPVAPHPISVPHDRLQHSLSQYRTSHSAFKGGYPRSLSESAVAPVPDSTLP